MIKNIQDVRFTRQHVKDIIKYIKTEETPDLPVLSYYHFIKKYNDEEFSVNKEGKLLFENREVVPLEDVNVKLEELYNDPNYYRASVSGFYTRIISEFVGISRSSVKEIQLLNAFRVGFSNYHRSLE